MSSRDGEAAPRRSSAVGRQLLPRIRLSFVHLSFPSRVRFQHVALALPGVIEPIEHN
jgi:hypothetical protein